MEYEQSNVLKDFPGLYSSESQKVNSRESDYSDEEKLTRKDILGGKKKDKKDKKDKEKGYAALEGESSAEEGFEIRSPTKSKKSKSFKFVSKSKEKREKSRDKEKESCDKKKDREKKIDKKYDKEKTKSDKREKVGDIAEELPIFGVPLEVAIERSKCHDGINLPLPFRACIDYLQMYGLGFEGIYKVSAPKTRILHLKKMYNHRETIDLSEHDVPTVTGLLKMFLRDLPESIFTSELLVRFEEAGAILNVGMREKHLKILLGNLPSLNFLLVSWLIVHLYTVTLNEKTTKMNAQSIATALSSTLQVSQRLLTAFLCHCPALFGDVKLIPYIPPLISTAQLPEEKELMEIELKKQESLLYQIHSEMNAGFVTKQREELLWEVQRIITQIKRRIRSKIQTKEVVSVEKNSNNNENSNVQVVEVVASTEPDEKNIKEAVPLNENNLEQEVVQEEPIKVEREVVSPLVEETLDHENEDLLFLTLKNKALLALKKKLTDEMEKENEKIAELKAKIEEINVKTMPSEPIILDSNVNNLDKIMELLRNENQILHIKKINLVRKIMEEQELCADLTAKLMLLNKTD